MKVVHISNSDLNGGAAIAALRINESLRNSEVDSAMLVQQKLSNLSNVESIVSRKVDGLLYHTRVFLDNISIRTLTLSERGRFNFPYCGVDIIKNESVQKADIINFHWINGGFLSLRSLSDLHKIVWTLHDMWAFTGGCHYNIDCTDLLSSAVIVSH